jgi:hypothetical protein
MKRREFITLFGGAAALWPLVARAQQRERMARIGVLWPGAPPDKWDEAFRQGLRAHGYVEGRNILLEYRWAEGNQERFPILAQELARLPLDVIVTLSAPAIRAVKEATTSVPIVFAGTSDPVRTGFAATLARPGGAHPLRREDSRLGHCQKSCRDSLEAPRLEIKKQLNALVSKTSRFRSLCLVIFGARARQVR